jgi:hypothetical protein
MKRLKKKKVNKNRFLKSSKRQRFFSDKTKLLPQDFAILALTVIVE